MIGTVDIGGTKLAVSLVDEGGKALAKNEIVTGSNSSYSPDLKALSACFAKWSNVRAEISGIGIGSTGPLDPLTGELGDLDFLPHWRRRNPVRDLSKLFGVDVARINLLRSWILSEELPTRIVKSPGSALQSFFSTS